MAYQEVLSTDTPNAGRSKWNSNDTELYSRPSVVLAATNPNATWVWTNMPAALTELFGLTNLRTKVNLSGFAQARVVAQVGTVGVAAAELRLQYSTDGTTWVYADGAAGPAVGIATLGTQVGAWVNLAAGAKADVFLRIVGINGDGVADPALSVVQVQAK